MAKKKKNPNTNPKLAKKRESEVYEKFYATVYEDIRLAATEYIGGNRDYLTREAIGKPRWPQEQA